MLLVFEGFWRDNGFDINFPEAVVKLGQLISWI